MFRKISVLTTLLLAYAAMVSAQHNTGSIKGCVITSDGQPGSFVTIQVKSSGRGTVTDVKGDFSLRKLEPGTYTLQLSLMGYNSKEQDVTVNAGSTTQVQIRLEVSDRQLSEVTITGSQRRFTNKESQYIAKLPLRNLENPQVYSVVNAQLLQQQVTTNLDDALKNVPGITKLWSSTGRPSDGAGYFSLRGFAVQPTMVNGLPGLTNGIGDPAYVERMEVLKGPSGTLYGSSLISFGGLINLVTRKPYDGFGGEIAYTAGSYGLNRVSADVNTPLKQDNSLTMRTIASYQSQHSWQDAGWSKSLFFAPSLQYRVNDKLTFNFNSVFSTGESTNALMVFLNRSRPLIAHNPTELGMDFKRSFTSDDITYKTPTINLQAQATYKISNNWTSQTNVSRSEARSNGYYSYVMFLDRGNFPQGANRANDTLLSRFVYHQNSTTSNTDIQQNFTGDFKIGNVRNRILVGFDYMQMEVRNDNSPYLMFDSVSAINRNDPNYYSLNRQSVDARLAATNQAGATKNRTTNNTYGVYISDVVNITDKLLAMASLRFDYFDYKGVTNYISNKAPTPYTQTAWSPKFGLVYQVVKDQVSVFANYMNGFQNVAPQTQPLPELNTTFKPQQANQLEGGVKLDVFNHKLSFTATYYDIKVNNILNQSVYTDANGNKLNYTTQGGKQSSRGVELEATANPLPGMNIVAGYSHNNSKLEDTYDYQEGLRPVTAGPTDLANLWISYAVSSGKLHGLGAGFGGNYVSDNVIANNRIVGKFTLPAYTVLNASVFYDTKKYVLTLKVNNLTNKEYYNGWTTVERQLPRNVAGSIAFRF